MPKTKESESVLVFDTREYVRTLTRGGNFSEGQADASTIEILKLCIKSSEETAAFRSQSLQEQVLLCKQMAILVSCMFCGFALVVALLTMFG